MSEWLITQRLVVAVTVVFLCYGAVTDWMREVDHAHEVHAVALCPAYDSMRVTPTAWEREHGRKVRWEQAPPCEEDR